MTLPCTQHNPVGCSLQPDSPFQLTLRAGPTESGHLLPWLQTQALGTRPRFGEAVTGWFGNGEGSRTAWESNHTANVQALSLLPANCRGSTGYSRISRVARHVHYHCSLGAGRGTRGAGQRVIRVVVPAGSWQPGCGGTLHLQSAVFVQHGCGSADLAVQQSLDLTPPKLAVLCCAVGARHASRPLQCPPAFCRCCMQTDNRGIQL